MPPMAKFEAGATKAVQCTVCNKKFARTDHLKRHQLRHSGVKPYSCIFCRDAFPRSDNLRDHYPSCTQRKNRQIPEAARGGRRSHACDTCTSMKLGCDGKEPCKTCRHKKIECRYSRLQSKSVATGHDSVLSTSSTGPSARQRPVPTLTTDRGSINFLLNSGTASFLDQFRFPSSHDTNNHRKNFFNFRNNQKSPGSNDMVGMYGNGSQNGSAFADFFEEEPIDWSFFEDQNLLRFLSTPINEIQGFGGPPVVTNLSTPEWEPASVQSAAIIQGIMESTTSLHLDVQEQTQLSQYLNMFFTPSRIDKFIDHYFKFWHPHCPILHQPSINVHTAPVHLLAAMCAMGSMFSFDDRDVNTGKLLLDLIEHYVYSVDDLTETSDIRFMFRSSPNPAPETTPMSMLAFQYLQAAYLMVCVQFWAGNLVARKRASDTRFAVVVRMTRKLGLTKVRHELDDSMDEHSWILKEGRIRFINTITLLDCAFLFFANFPTRISFTEMNFELPCEESLWSSHHPFAEPSFTPNRSVTLFEAFQSLFGYTRPGPLPVQSAKGNPYGLNPMDMFTLIHLIHVHAHTQITQYSSTFTKTQPESGNSTPRMSNNVPIPIATPSNYLPGSPIPSSTFPAPANPTSASTLPTSQPTTTSSPSTSNPPPPSSDPHSNLNLIRQSLSSWRSLWITIRSSISNTNWDQIGFFRNGFNYWLVIQLLINTKGIAADILMGMEVGCEDALAQLRGLLAGGGGGIGGAEGGNVLGGPVVDASIGGMKLERGDG